MIKHRKKMLSGKSVIMIICIIAMLACSGCSYINNDEISSDAHSTQNSVSSSEAGSGNSISESKDQTAGTEPTGIQEDIDSSDAETTGIIWYSDNTWVYVNNSWLNIRNGPSTDNAIITEVYHAQSLKRVAVSDYWSEIILPDGRTGYAYNTYLSLIPIETTANNQ